MAAVVPAGVSTMAVKAAFVVAAALAVAIAMLLPAPRVQPETRTSQFQTMDIGEG